MWAGPSAREAGRESLRIRTGTASGFSFCQNAELQVKKYGGSSLDSSSKAAGGQRYYRWRVGILNIG